VCGSIAFFVVIRNLGGRGWIAKAQAPISAPKVSIEGHGIKRSLTAVEAAILLEQPMDKILTMILFGTIKKAQP
jgi:hypothetical protein